jgi:hypothetical protein
MASHTSPPVAAYDDIDVELTCIDGLLAGTMALMTGYAEHQCEQGSAHSRNLMAKKILSNLHFLATHPRMPQPMAAVLRNLHKHWHTLTALGALEDSASVAPSSASPCAASQAQQGASPAAMWLPAHASVQ